MDTTHRIPTSAAKSYGLPAAERSGRLRTVKGASPEPAALRRATNCM